jgi:hypothetical protein
MFLRDKLTMRFEGEVEPRPKFRFFVVPGSRRTSPAWYSQISSRSARASGTPLIAGRNLTDRDRKGAPPVVVVNQAFARKFLNGS